VQRAVTTATIEFTTAGFQLALLEPHLVLFEPRQPGQQVVQQLLVAALVLAGRCRQPAARGSVRFGRGDEVREVRADRARLLVGVTHEAETSLGPSEQLVHRFIADRIAIESVHQRAFAEIDRSLIGTFIRAALQTEDGRRLLPGHRLEQARQREIDQIAFNH
jgi:hypothetical protein